MHTSSLLKALCISLLLTLTGCSGAAVSSSGEKSVVLVAGATGGTGRALVRNLQAQGYAVRAFVRDRDKAVVVLGADIEYAQGDVRDPESVKAAMSGATYVISAIGAGQADPENTPEVVDFAGVRNLATAAAEAGVRQFVLVSSAGVTQEDHFLNKMFNNVMTWKFKGEEALRESGVAYTIVRPGGLINTPGGKDKLVFEQGDTSAGRISREDVALICIAALKYDAARNRTFETYSSEDAGPNDWARMFGALRAD